MRIISMETMILPIGVRKNEVVEKSGAKMIKDPRKPAAKMFRFRACLFKIKFVKKSKRLSNKKFNNQMISRNTVTAVSPLPVSIHLKNSIPAFVLKVCRFMTAKNDMFSEILSNGRYSVLKREKGKII